MAPPPITEITIKAKKVHKRKSHNVTEWKEEEKLEAIPEEEETRHQQNATAPPGPPLHARSPSSRTRRNPEELESHLLSLRRKVMDRSEISSLSSRSYFDDSTASFNPTKPQAIFRTRTPPKCERVAKPSTINNPIMVGMPERPSVAEKDKTPLRRNHGPTALQANVASMPAAAPLAMPNVTQSQTDTVTPNDTPSLFQFDNNSIQTYSTAGSTQGSVLDTMTKRAVQNILENYLFDENKDGYSLSPLETNEVDSYFGSVQVRETVKDKESRVKRPGDVSVQKTKHEADSKRLQANKNDGNTYLKESESTSALVDEYSYCKENESASVLVDEYSYFGQEMDVTSLTGSVQADETVLDEKSDIESLPMNVTMKQNEIKKKYDRDVDVKSLRVKKSDVKSLRVKKNDEVIQSKENENTHFEVESFPVDVSVKKKKHVSDVNVKSLRTKKNDDKSFRAKKDDEKNSCHGKEVDVTSLMTSKYNENVSRQNENSYFGKMVDVTNLLSEKVELTPSENGILASSRLDEDLGFEKELCNASLPKDSKALASQSKRDLCPRPDEDLVVKEKDVETTGEVITAVKTLLPHHEVDPLWQDDEHHDEEKAKKSTIATSSDEVQLMGEPFTFRRKFMLLFLILGVATIAGGVASFVTSRFQGRNNIEATHSPITSAPTSEPTTEPTESTLTPKPTSQPTTRLWAAPTVSNANVDTTTPTSTNAPSVSTNLSLREQIELMSPESVPSLANATSPQSRALEWASQQPNPSLTGFGLATLRFATNTTTGWKNEEGWLTLDVCEWYGVVCRDNKVVEIYLSFNNLGSTLPDEVSLLTDLQVLSISGSAETLNTKGNVVGAIPFTWGERLVNLIALELYDNRLTGQLPSNFQYLTGLETLNLDGNNLRGPLPTELGMMTHLKTLDLSNNFLSGAIPTEVGLLSNLLHLRLHENELTGSLPTEIGSLETLNELELQGNALTGSLPTSLYSLTNLTWLDVSRNQLSDIVPSSIGKLSNLEGLLCQENQLRGPIPVQLASLSSLRSFNVSRNELTGTIVSNLGLLTSLVELSLEDNLLEGSVPETVCNSLTLLRHFSYSSDCQACPCCTECLN